MRRLIAFGALAALPLSLSVSGCSSDDRVSGVAPNSQVAQAIIGGILDNGQHPAVVAYEYDATDVEAYFCSGTIFKTDVANNVGYVLLASHCILGDGTGNVPTATPNKVHIITGDNYATAGSGAYHQAVELITAPGANPPNPEYDVAIVKFSGVTADTPTLPLTTLEMDADLAAGQAVEIVGFGKTTPADNNQNSRKWKLDTTLNEFDLGSSIYDAVDELTIAAPAGPMGQTTCEGDSGGPWMRTVNGQQYVLAVTSIGDTGCMLGGVASRVAPLLDSFVNPYVNGGTVMPTCKQCTDKAETTSCLSAASACQQNLDCYAEAQQCNCASTDASCISDCMSAHSGGTQLYDALVACYCQSSVCNPECASNLCQGMSGAGGAGGGGGSGGSGGEAGSGGSDANAGAGGESGGAGGSANAGAANGGNAGSTSTAGHGGVSAAGSGGASAGTSATGGASNAGTAGSGGTAADTTNATPASSDSGGCSLAVPPSGGGLGAGLGVAALAWLVGARRRREPKNPR